MISQRKPITVFLRKIDMDKGVSFVYIDNYMFNKYIFIEKYTHAYKYIYIYCIYNYAIYYLYI